MIQEDISSVVDEESLIIDVFCNFLLILDEQDSISMMFIDDGWVNDSESDLYSWQE